MRYIDRIFNSARHLSRAAHVLLNEVAGDSQVTSHNITDSEVAWCQDTLKKLDTGAPRSLAVTLDHFSKVFQDRTSDGPLGSLTGCISREFCVRPLIVTAMTMSGRMN